MKLGRVRRSIAAFVLVTLVLVVDAPGAPSRALGTFDLNVTFNAGYRFGEEFCPPERRPGMTDCIRFTGAAGVRGLGTVTETYVKYFADVCGAQVVQPERVVFAVKGKGEIHIAMQHPVCAAPAPSEAGPIAGTVTGGTGRFAGASGSLQFRTVVSAASAGPRGFTGSSRDTWTGAIVIPGLEPDLTPPVITATATAARAPKKAKRVRVRYKVGARDAVDGTVAANCQPRSGSRFKIGRTKVTCTATDSSLNKATVIFTVTVKRRR